MNHFHTAVKRFFDSAAYDFRKTIIVLSLTHSSQSKNFEVSVIFRVGAIKIINKDGLKQTNVLKKQVRLEIRIIFILVE